LHNSLELIGLVYYASDWACVSYLRAPGLMSEPSFSSKESHGAFYMCVGRINTVSNADQELLRADLAKFWY